MLGSEFFLSLHSLPERAMELVVNLELRMPSRDDKLRADVTPRVVTSLAFRTTSPDDFPLIRGAAESGTLAAGKFGRDTRLVLVMTGELT